MKLVYHSWDVDKRFTAELIDKISKVPPLDKIFTDASESDSLPAYKKDIFYKRDSIYDAVSIVIRIKRDISKERHLVVTRNQFFPLRNDADMMMIVLGGLRAYGCAFGNEGVAFIRPIRHDQQRSRKLNLDYALELACHELGGTFEWNDWEKCKDKSCFAYGKMSEDTGGIIVPPYGRNHYCSNHLEILVQNAQRFRIGELP